MLFVMSAPQKFAVDVATDWLAALRWKMTLFAAASSIAVRRTAWQPPGPSTTMWRTFIPALAKLVALSEAFHARPKFGCC